MDNMRVVAVKKKPLVLVLPYLGSVPLQTMIKLKKSLKTSLIVVKCKVFNISVADYIY